MTKQMAFDDDVWYVFAGKVHFCERLSMTSTSEPMTLKTSSVSCTWQWVSFKYVDALCTAGTDEKMPLKVFLWP